jgi:alpha-tubulin suppressor-like RCC1 family protein
MIHSGCVLSDGSVYQWGTCGDYKTAVTHNNPEEMVRKVICMSPIKVSFTGCMEVIQNQTSTSVSGSLSNRRKSGQVEAAEQYATPAIMDLKMGEQFSIALSTRGYVYSWGLNDMG